MTEKNPDKDADADYCSKYLSPEIVEKLEAAAFRSLCQHLQERSDQVQNMELMTMSGFCRNCLAKWMVLEARQMVDRGDLDGNKNDDDDDGDKNSTFKHALDAFGYEEAAHHVYGMTYGDWKKRHQKKATDEQMERFNASKDLQAKHDKKLLATRATNEPPAAAAAATATTKDADAAPPDTAATQPLASNVCCQDVDEGQSPTATKKTDDTTSDTKVDHHHHHHSHDASKGGAASSKVVGPFQPPSLPTNLPDQLRVGVLTVSDRASRNEYEKGDLSGPAVVEAVEKVLGGDGSGGKNENDITSSTVAIVPDDQAAIQAQLESWARDENLPMHVILTTGGTGFSPRDVTPEATRAVLDQECGGLMAFVTTECSRLQPLASLSRGIAGFSGKTMIANLPGNPKGVAEVVPVLLPVLLHAVADLHSSRGQ